MSDTCLHLAIIHEVYPTTSDHHQLFARLQEARNAGAELAVLPELPLDHWVPARREPCNDDAEAPNGPRHCVMREAAAAAGIALLGGTIVRDPETGRRHNQAIVFDSHGEQLGTFRKTHLPQEEGFWESSHYDPGDMPPRAIDGLPMPIGIQICSDANRPEGTQQLAHQGAQVVFVPRATPMTSYERWKLVLRANAVTAAVYVVSINRPGPEAGVPIGGPSLVIAPDATVLSESSDPLQLVRLSQATVRESRRSYPGYLDVRPELYIRGWQAVSAN